MADKDEVTENHSVNKENGRPDQRSKPTSEETIKCYGEDETEVEKPKAAVSKDNKFQILLILLHIPRLSFLIFLYKKSSYSLICLFNLLTRWKVNLR